MTDLDVALAAMRSSWPGYDPDDQLVGWLSDLIEDDADATMAAVRALTTSEAKPPPWATIREAVVQAQSRAAKEAELEESIRQRMEAKNYRRSDGKILPRPEIAVWWLRRIHERIADPYRYPPHTARLPEHSSARLPVASCPGCAADIAARDEMFAEQHGPLVPGEMFAEERLVPDDKDPSKLEEF